MLSAPFVAGPVAAKPMKPVNWNKLPMRKLGKSIWTQEIAEGSESIKLDTELLDHFFTDYPKIREEEKKLLGDVAAKRADGKKADEKVKFLDQKRSQHISIIASSIKSSATQLREALEVADTTVLTPEIVERLMALCPIAKSELVSCQEYAASLDSTYSSQDICVSLSLCVSLCLSLSLCVSLSLSVRLCLCVCRSLRVSLCVYVLHMYICTAGSSDELLNAGLDKLDRAERYLFELSKIDGLEGRLRCLHLQQHFDEWSTHCEASMEVMITACTEVDTSGSLPVLLRYILSAGNYLNSGTLASHRKNARGVKLDFLLELQKTTTRGHPKMKKIVTFLQLMQLQISEHAPKTDAWTSEVGSLEEACTIDLSSVKLNMERISEGVTELQKQLGLISVRKYCIA